MSTAPYTILVAPFTVRIAIPGTAFPVIEPVTSYSGWDELGSSVYSEDGVTVEHGQTIDYHYVQGSNAPVKATRSREFVRVSFVVHDAGLETIAQALGTTTSTVIPTSSTVGRKEMSIYRGGDVNQYSLMIRGASPYYPALSMQYNIPLVVPDSEPTLVFNKKVPVGVSMSFMLLDAPISMANYNGRFGRIVAAYTPDL